MITLRSENSREQIAGILLIIVGVALRLLPHAENFTPVTAIALFSGVVLSPAIALTVPLIVMIISDLIIGPHDLFLLTWGSFFLITLLGVSIRRNPKWNRIFFGALGGSVFYFIATNLGVFLFENMYPKTWAGLVECFVMAIPFFRNSLISDLFFTALFFTLFVLYKHFSNTAVSQKIIQP